jgi:serine protease AprX
VADDVVPSWSSRGDGRNPDLVAPGRSIASLRDPNSALDLAHPEARVGDALLKGSGTSQAAGVVSGSVALLLEKRPDLTPDQVKALLTGTADPLAGAAANAQGAGRIDVARALAAPAPDPASVVQNFQPAQINGLVAKLVAALGSGRHAAISPVSPDGAKWNSKWNGAKWGGSSWGGSSWGGSSWGGSSWGGSSWGGSSWGGSSWGGSSWGGSSWGGSSWGGSSWGGASWGDG